MKLSFLQIRAVSFEPIAAFTDTVGENTARNQTGRGSHQPEATWSVAVAVGGRDAVHASPALGARGSDYDW